MFNVGDKVVCVNATKQPHTIDELNKDVPNWVAKDEEYTIREICDYDFVVAILLEEISNPPLFFKLLGRVAEPAFASWRFRKTADAETINEEIKEEIYV